MYTRQVRQFTDHPKLLLQPTSIGIAGQLGGLKLETASFMICSLWILEGHAVLKDWPVEVQKYWKFQRQ